MCHSVCFPKGVESLGVLQPTRKIPEFRKHICIRRVIISNKGDEFLVVYIDFYWETVLVLEPFGVPVSFSLMLFSICIFPMYPIIQFPLVSLVTPPIPLLPGLPIENASLFSL